MSTSLPRPTSAAWAALLVVCVGTRLGTTIGYVEDPDSLRFALSVADAYDLAALQPHFPGYPVFWAAVKPFAVVLGSFSTAFSLVGGLATAGIVGALVLLRSVPLASRAGAALAGAVVLNPLVWLMANRYMPDLLGTACALFAMAALVRALPPGAGRLRPFDGRVNERLALAGIVATGLLAGLRLSYLPLVALPAVAVLWVSAARLRLIAAGLAATAVWLVPMILDTGWTTLLDVAWRQTEGHFTEFGGTVQTEADLGRRTAGFVRGLWADGLGAWWPGRHPLTAGVGAAVLGLAAVGARCLARRTRWRSRRLWIAVLGILSYALWVFFFQNVIHKSRHVLPLLPLLLMLPAAGAVALWRHSPWGRGAVAATILLYGSVTAVLVHQHRSPSAIAQAKTFVQSQTDTHAPVRVASVPLVNTYLRHQQVDARYVSVEDSADVDRLRRIVSQNAAPGRTLVIGTYPSLFDHEPTAVRRFYHNPFVNRMWPEVTVSIYDH